MKLRLEIRDGVVLKPTCVVGPQVPSYVAWDGQIHAIHRLLNGFDPLLIHALKQRGVSDEDVASLTREFATPLVHSAMPIQDAIDLADFLVDLAKKYSAFSPSANIVGGDTDIACVTRHEGFKWIKRKYYYSRRLNPRETGHAT